MALFKILKGNKSSLPTKKVEGWMYITKDTGDIYVDISSSTPEGEVETGGERLQLCADKAYRLKDSNDSLISIGGEKTPVYFKDGIPVSCGPISTDHIYNTSNEVYPILFTNEAGNTDTTNRESADAALVNTIYVNPSTGELFAEKVWGAVWNDYAEFRETMEEIEPGRVVIENGDDTLSLSIERLQPGANIVSDTYGMAIGKTEYSQTPIAVSGRVLAYPLEDRD